MKEDLKINNHKIYEVRLLDKISCEVIFFLKLLIICFFLASISGAIIGSFYDKKILKINSYDDFERLYVNYASEYDYLSKEQIYRIRKRHVKDSIFNRENYEPKEEIFGSIQDNKPWWGDVRCSSSKEGFTDENTQGDSLVSIQMNNPNVLVGVTLSYLARNDDISRKTFCEENLFNLVPTSLKYSKKDNLIVAKYEVDKRFLDYKFTANGKSGTSPIQFSGLNAKDFGYNYVYALNYSGMRMFFNGEDDFNRKPVFFSDYICVGASCRYEGGCNNLCPLQSDKTVKLYKIPAQITMKLWKDEPSNKSDKADMYYKIIFEEKF